MKDAALSQPPASSDSAVNFLNGAGETAALIRAFDWSATSLGPIQDWPQSLKTATGMVLHSPVPLVMLWGVEGYMIYNDAYSVFAAARHPLLLGSNVREGWPEVADFNDNVMKVGLAGGTLAYRDQELTLYRHGTPEQVWMNLDYSPVMAEDGQPAGVIAIVVETTERVLADRRAAEEQERQRQLFAQMPGFVAVLSGPQHVYEYVNQAYLKVAGERDFIGRSVREIFPDLEGQGFYELLDQVYTTGDRYTAREMAIDLMGEMESRYIDFLYEPMRNERGEITGIFVGGYDVTEAHRSATALRESEADLRALNADLERQVTERAQGRSTTWEVSPYLLCVMTPDGMFESVNPSWPSLLGWSSGELTTAAYPTFVHPDDLERSYAAFEQVTRGEPVLGFENRYRTKGGDYRWLSWVAVPDGGKIYCMVRDVTADKEAAAELAQAQDALRQSQKLEAMGQLTGGVAHDFNNLLTPIVGSLDMLLRRGLQDDRERRLVNGAMEAAERAKILVQRLLAFSRRQPLQTGPVDIAALIGGMAELVATTTGPQIKVTVDIASDLPPAVADPNQLEMAILNLSVNARDAMPGGGALRLSASRETVAADHPTKLKPGEYVRLSVADTGVGMDEETLSRAVEPFFSTKGVGKGTGLGLSMAHGLASQLGGMLTISSTQGQGANVELWLPATTAADDVRGRPGAAPSIPATAGAALLVDDEDLARASTAEMLTDLGYSVVEAPSAEAALKLLDEGLKPDVVVTDHLMPGKTGVELAREVQNRRLKTPVVIISGYADLEDLAPDLPRLTKPFRQADLAGMLAGVEGKPAAS